MRKIPAVTLAVILLSLMHAVSQDLEGGLGQKGEIPRPLTPADKKAVEQAIVDEIYLNDLEGYGFDVGKQISDSRYELNAYFKPTLNSENAGWVIYKLMPYGEVYRMFYIRSDGLAVLFGKLRDRFPPTQPSYLTVYIDDDELCRMKTEWQKGRLTVELKPSADRLAEARARQQKRQ